MSHSCILTRTIIFFSVISYRTATKIIKLNITVYEYINQTLESRKDLKLKILEIKNKVLKLLWYDGKN